MNLLVSSLYSAHLLFGSFCAMHMAAAMPMPGPMHHMGSTTEVAMTPVVPMTPAFPMTPAPVIHFTNTMPMLPIWDCSMGHCIVMDHSNQERASVSTGVAQVITHATLPTFLFSVSTVLDSLPAPPDIEKSSLAHTLSTVVLRV